MAARMTSPLTAAVNANAALAKKLTKARGTRAPRKTGGYAGLLCPPGKVRDPVTKRCRAPKRLTYPKAALPSTVTGKTIANFPDRYAALSFAIAQGNKVLKAELNKTRARKPARKPCAEGKVRNPKTGRCSGPTKGASAKPARKPCAEGKVRDAVTKRCRAPKSASKAAVTKAARMVTYTTSTGKTRKADSALATKPCQRPNQVRMQSAPYKCMRRGGAAAKKTLGARGCPDGKVLIKGTRPVGGKMREYSRCVKPKGAHKNKAAQTVCVAPKLLATKRKAGMTPARPAYTTKTGRFVAAQPSRSYNTIVTRCVRPSSVAKLGWTAVAGAVQAPKTYGSFSTIKNFTGQGKDLTYLRTGKRKPCAAGKFRNPATGRCGKPKTAKKPRKATAAKKPRTAKKKTATPARAKTATPPRAKTATPARAKTATPKKRAASQSPKRASPAKKSRVSVTRRSARLAAKK
jgi:histone H1/5